MHHRIRLLVFLLAVWQWVLPSRGTTHIYPPDAVADMERDSAERFRQKWSAVEIADGSYPMENGIWVTYKHENLTYFIGPYPTQEAAVAGKGIFERIRQRLLEADPAFRSSQVGVLTLDLDRSLLQSGELPPAHSQKLDGVVELKPPQEELPSQATETETNRKENTEKPPPRLSQHGGGFVPTDPAVYAQIPTAFPPFYGHALPPAYDLSSGFPPVGQQKSQNSCTGWTLAYGIKSYQEARSEGWSLRGFFGGVNPRHVFSPSFIYNQINGRVDEGSSLLDGLTLAQSNGVCRLSSMPYKEYDYRSAPSLHAQSEASVFKIETFRRVKIDDLTGIKAYLRAGYPLAVGLMADPELENLRGRQIWSKTNPGQAAGHALIATGYDDTRKAFRLYNSWGKKWADGGQGWIAYTLWPQVVQEAYILKDGPNSSTFIPPAPGAFRVAITNATIQTDGSLFFSGHADSPAAYAGTLQIEVQLEDARGHAVPGQLQAYQTVHGQASTVSRPRRLRESSTRVPWTAEMPGANLPSRPVTGLQASPVLFIDRFGLVRGTRHSLPAGGRSTLAPAGKK